METTKEIRETLRAKNLMAPPIPERMEALEIVFRTGRKNKVGIEPVVWMEEGEPVAGYFCPAFDGRPDYVIPRVLVREPEGKALEGAIKMARDFAKDPENPYGPFKTVKGKMYRDKETGNCFMCWQEN